MALTQQAVPAPQPRLGPSGLLVENEFEVSLNFEPLFITSPFIFLRMISASNLLNFMLYIEKCLPINSDSQTNNDNGDCDGDNIFDGDGTWG